MKRKSYILIAVVALVVLILSLYVGPITHAGNPEGWGPCNFIGTVVAAGVSFVTLVLCSVFAIGWPSND